MITMIQGEPIWHIIWLLPTFTLSMVQVEMNDFVVIVMKRIDDDYDDEDEVEVVDKESSCM